MGCGVNKSTRPAIISFSSLSCGKKIKLSEKFIKKKNYKNIISHKSWTNVFDFLSYNEIKEVGKTNKLFNHLVRQNQILVKFFKNKNTFNTVKIGPRSLIRGSSIINKKTHIQFYESFALLQLNQLCESLDSNCSTTSERLIV